MLKCVITFSLLSSPPLMFQHYPQLADKETGAYRDWIAWPGSHGLYGGRACTPKELSRPSLRCHMLCCLFAGGSEVAWSGAV